MLAAWFVFISGVWIMYTLAEFSKIEENEAWSLYLSRDCTIEEKALRFPDIYGIGSNTTEIGPPINFTVTYFEKQHEDDPANFVYPGLTIGFYPPEIGFDSVTGYEVQLTWKTFTACLVYVPNQASSERKITSEIFPIYNLTSYWLVMTSLPAHSLNQSTEAIQLVSSIEHYIVPTDKLPEPADWFAHIAHDVIKTNDTRSLQIIFSRPPPQYGFHRFQIALVPVEDYIHVKSVMTVGFYHEFRTVEAGHYKISIEAIDDFFSQYGRCRCHDYGKCTNCLSSETAVFAID